MSRNSISSIGSSTSSESISSAKDAAAVESKNTAKGGFGGRGSKGLDVKMGAFFMIAQMAGAGFLSLPRAMADTGEFISNIVNNKHSFYIPLIKIFNFSLALHTSLKNLKQSTLL